MSQFWALKMSQSGGCPAEGAKRPERGLPAGSRAAVRHGAGGPVVTTEPDELPPFPPCSRAPRHRRTWTHPYTPETSRAPEAARDAFSRFPNLPSSSGQRPRATARGLRTRNRSERWRARQAGPASVPRTMSYRRSRTGGRRGRRPVHECQRVPSERGEREGGDQQRAGQPVQTRQRAAASCVHLFHRRLFTVVSDSLERLPTWPPIR